MLHATDAGPNQKETKWHLVLEAAEFTRLANTANRQNKRTTVVVFLTESDVQGGLFPNVHLRLTAETFVDVLARIDRTCTFMGVCGKRCRFNFQAMYVRRRSWSMNGKAACAVA